VALPVGPVARFSLYTHASQMDAACHLEESRTGSGLPTRHRRDRPHCRRLTAHRELALPPGAGRSLPPAYDPATWPVDWAPREASRALGRGADAHAARTGIAKASGEGLDYYAHRIASSVPGQAVDGDALGGRAPVPG
jgi:hypothetical protein